MRQQGVSVAIVVGGRESRPHGEGPQLARWVRRNPPECEDGEDRSMSGEHAGPQIPLRRRPYAVKAARTVTTGGDGETGHKEPRSVPTHSRRCQQNAKGAVSPIGGGRVRCKSHARSQRGGWENTVWLCVLSLPTPDGPVSGPKPWIKLA
jgi:hypothetical protein